MLQLKKILVPTDFSACASEALRLATELAARFDGSVTLLHVYQIPAYPLAEGTFVGGPQVTAEIVKDIVSALDKTKKEADSRVPVTTQIAEGVPYLEVARVAREGKFDLVVIGTHGRTGLRHALLGSVAEKVVRGASCPVLTVRSPEQVYESP
jgi:nucleotide-binding universal stress UspA family protein